MKLVPRALHTKFGSFRINLEDDLLVLDLQHGPDTVRVGGIKYSIGGLQLYIALNDDERWSPHYLYWWVRCGMPFDNKSEARLGRILFRAFQRACSKRPDLDARCRGAVGEAENELAEEAYAIDDRVA